MKKQTLDERVLAVLAHAAAQANKVNPSSKHAKEFTSVYFEFRNSLTK